MSDARTAAARSDTGHDDNIPPYPPPPLPPLPPLPLVPEAVEVEVEMVMVGLPSSSHVAGENGSGPAATVRKPCAAESAER